MLGDFFDRNSPSASPSLSVNSFHHSGPSFDDRHATRRPRNLPSSLSSYSETRHSQRLPLRSPSTPTFCHHSIASASSARPFRVSDWSASFRLVVAQNLFGDPQGRAVLFDSALGQAAESPAQGFAPRTLDRSRFHPALEIAAYMFGSKVPIPPLKTLDTQTKLIVLPALPQLASSVLIARLFPVDSHFDTVPLGTPTKGDWIPRPCAPCRSVPKHRSSCTWFSCGVVCPVSEGIDSIEEIVTNNFAVLEDAMASIQQTVVDELYKLCQDREREGAVLPRLLKFEEYFLQDQYEVSNQLARLVQSLVDVTEIRRLFVPIKSSNEALVSWARSIASWLEMKDGRYFLSSNPSVPNTSPGLKFLASLLYIVLPLRGELLQTPCNRSRKHCVRVVVVTTNPPVSTKLVSMLAGLLTYHEELPLSARLLPGTNSDNSSVEKLVPEEATARPDNASTATVKPISIKPARSVSESSTVSISPVGGDSDSFAEARGWTVRSKAAPSTFSSPVVSQFPHAQPEGITIPMVRRESSYASLQNLSSSYGRSTLGSSLSSSWKGPFKLGYVLDHWRRGPTTPGSNRSQDYFDSTLARTPTSASNDYFWMGGNPSSSSLNRIPPGGKPHLDSIPSFSSSSSGGAYSNDSGPRRSATRILPRTEVDDATSSRISSIMRSEFSLVERGGVMNVISSALGDMPAANPDTTTLPLFGGYTEKLVPEFSLMACSDALDETTLNDCLSNDVQKMGPGSVSDIYLVRLKQREVSKVHLKYSETPVAAGASKLTDQLQRRKAETKVIFSPRVNSESKLDQFLLSMGKSAHSHSVEEYDELLNRIARLVKDLSSEESSGNGDEDDDKTKAGSFDDDIRCKQLRETVEELLQ